MLVARERGVGGSGFVDQIGRIRAAKVQVEKDRQGALAQQAQGLGRSGRSLEIDLVTEQAREAGRVLVAVLAHDDAWACRLHDFASAAGNTAPMDFTRDAVSSRTTM